MHCTSEIRTRRGGKQIDIILYRGIPRRPEFVNGGITGILKIGVQDAARPRRGPSPPERV